MRYPIKPVPVSRRELENAATPGMVGLLGAPAIMAAQRNQPSKWAQALQLIDASRKDAGGSHGGRPSPNAVQGFPAIQDRYRRAGEGLERRKRQATSVGGVMSDGPPSGQRGAGWEFGKLVMDALLSGVDPAVIADIIRPAPPSRPRVAQAGDFLARTKPNEPLYGARVVPFDSPRNNEAAAPVPGAAIRRVQAGGTPLAGAAVAPLGTTPITPLAQVQRMAGAVPEVPPRSPSSGQTFAALPPGRNSFGSGTDNGFVGHGLAGNLSGGNEVPAAGTLAFAAQDAVGFDFASSEGGRPALSQAPVQLAADAGDTGDAGDAGEAGDRADVYVEYPLNAPANGSGAAGEAEQRWASNEFGRLRVIEDEAAPGGHLQRTFVVEPTTSLTNPAGWVVQRVVKEYRGELEDGTEASFVAVEHEAFRVNRGRTTTAQREPRDVRGEPDDEFIRTRGDLVRGSVVVTATAQYIRDATIPTEWGSRLDNPHFRTTGEIALAPGEDPSNWFDKYDDDIRGTPASGAWTTKYTINWGDPQQ